MKYLATTSKEVYEILRNAANSVLPKVNLPKSIRSDLGLFIKIDSYKKDDETPAETILFSIVDKAKDAAIIYYSNSKLDKFVAVTSVEKLFMNLQKMKSYDQVRVLVRNNYSVNL